MDKPDIEKWKKIVISLPEQVFFDLIRNYLGDVKTPFNKHSLIEELAAFFRKEKNIERIISLIDKNDAAVLSAIDILAPVTIKNLYRLFSDKKNYYDFCMHLQNLEERMLICTDESSDGYPMVIISPLIRDFLGEKVLNPVFLISGTAEGAPVAGNRGWLTDSLLFSVFSFLLRKGQILKLNGNFRKKVTEELKLIFPDQLSTNPDIKIDIIRKMFRRLGLVRQEGDYFKPVVERWKELSLLPREERISLCVAASFSRDYRLYYNFAERIMRGLCSSGMGFTEKALCRVIELFFIKNSLPLPEDTGMVVKILEGLGFIEKKENFYFPDSNYASAIREKEDSEKHVTFTVQPNFDIHVSGDISFRDGIALALASEIDRYSEMIIFTLSRESFLRALEAGYDSAEVAALFNGLGGYSVPQNVMFSMESWEKEYKSLAFYSGIVLVTDEKKGNIIDNSGQFSQNLCRKLAPNVYLVSKKNINSLFEAFRKAGIDNLPSPSSIAPEDDEEIFEERTEGTSFSSDMANIAGLVTLDLDFSRNHIEVPETVDPDSPEIREKIEKSRYSSEQKEVLSGRVERKLILFPEQISSGTARYEKTEARGLDYNGKVRIAEEVAGKSGYLVEIVENNSEGETVKRLIKAEKVEKDGSNVFLKGQLLQDESEVTI